MSLKTVAEKQKPTAESAATAILSMRLRSLAPEAKAIKTPQKPANAPDEIEDMWDNMPV